MKNALPYIDLYPRDGDVGYVIIVRYCIEPGFGVECSQLSEFVIR
jgi:hypothetical protein